MTLSREVVLKILKSSAVLAISLAPPLTGFADETSELPASIEGTAWVLKKNLPPHCKYQPLPERESKVPAQLDCYELANFALTRIPVAEENDDDLGMYLPPEPKVDQQAATQNSEGNLSYLSTIFGVGAGARGDVSDSNKVGTQGGGWMGVTLQANRLRVQPGELGSSESDCALEFGAGADTKNGISPKLKLDCRLRSGYSSTTDGLGFYLNYVGAKLQMGLSPNLARIEAEAGVGILYIQGDLAILFGPKAGPGVDLLNQFDIYGEFGLDGSLTIKDKIRLVLSAMINGEELRRKSTNLDVKFRATFPMSESLRAVLDTQVTTSAPFEANKYYHGEDGIGTAVTGAAYLISIY